MASNTLSLKILGEVLHHIGLDFDGAAHLAILDTLDTGVNGTEYPHFVTGKTVLFALKVGHLES